MDMWLDQDPENVSGVHCKAGKGRTGVMISCYLIWKKVFNNATDSLKYYGVIRTNNKKVQLNNNGQGSDYS